MGVRVSKGQYNLATLAGAIEVLTIGHSLPLDLYVFGTQGEERCVYIDPVLEHAKEIRDFLTNKGISAYVEMPYNPNQRPAVGLSRGFRDDSEIDLAARVVVFVLFCMHETIRMSVEDLDAIYP